MPTLDEYKAKINEMVSTPDRVPMIAIELADAISDDLNTLASLVELKTKHEERIADLQDTNQKLFLRTTAAPENEVPESTPEQELDSLLEKWNK